MTNCEANLVGDCCQTGVRQLTIDTSKWDSDTREAFSEAFLAISGIAKEADNQATSPWSAPWHWANSVINVRGTGIYDWAQDFWLQCRDDYEDSATVVVFHPEAERKFSVSRCTQKDWCSRHGLSHFDQHSQTGVAENNERYFLHDADAVVYLNTNKERFIDYSEEDTFSAEEIIAGLAA